MIPVHFLLISLGQPEVDLGWCNFAVQPQGLLFYKGKPYEMFGFRWMVHATTGAQQNLQSNAAPEAYLEVVLCEVGKGEAIKSAGLVRADAGVLGRLEAAARTSGAVKG